MFSVIIPLYNKAPYIIRCLNSVFAQTYSDFEVIVINDGSTDSGLALINEHFPDVKLINQENQGVSAARNAGITAASKKYIAFLDADDAWHPAYLYYASKLIEENGTIKIIGTHYSSEKDTLDHQPSPLEYYLIADYFKIAIKNTLFLPSSTIVNKEIVDKHSLTFNSKFKLGEDLDFWFRINIIEGKAFYIKNTLVYYSDDDLLRTTNVMGDFKGSLLSNILTIYRPYFSTNKSLKQFINLFVLFNLYPYYYNRLYHADAKKVYATLSDKIFLLRIIYMLPAPFGYKIVSKPICKKTLRLYLKVIRKYLIK